MKGFIYGILKKIIPLPIKKKIREILVWRKFGTITEKLRATKGASRLILIGTPTHGNLGDHAIARAEAEFFDCYLPSTAFIEIPMPLYVICARRIKKYITPKDVLLTSGGGWLGTLWSHNEETVRGIIKSYPDNKIVLLPQTVFYDESEFGKSYLNEAREIYPKHKNLIFCLREKNSYNFVINNGLGSVENCVLMPDMVFFLNRTRDSQRSGVVLCLREDRELVADNREKIEKCVTRNGEIFSYSDTHIHGEVPLDMRDAELDKKFGAFSGARLVITDRLHGMLFSLITGTPCIAFDNVTRKVEGTYFTWLQDIKYIRLLTNQDLENLSFHIGEMLKMSGQIYDNSRFLKYYDDLSKKVGS